MSYQVLARKWRPHSFHEMVGQEHVLRALVHALDQQRLHHAFLFSGTRGVGKTTIGRILARCLNCEQGVSSRPCGTCGTCEEIVAGRHVDLIEVDAASQTKVEQTRELLENAQYAPSKGRYKVYLIDEVHMLSRSSFNALLKTLEEPPDHVKFLLATTDPQKVPVTVLSRCLQFNLKNLSRDLIRERLAFVLEQESIQFEPEALSRLAQAAQGSMRDALSLTDQAIAFGNGEVLDTDVRSMLGDIEHDEIYRLMAGLRGEDGAELLGVIDSITEHNGDCAAVLDELLMLLHRLAVLQVLPAEAAAREQYDARERELAAEMTAEDVQLYYQIGLHGRRDLPLAPDARTGLEMCLLRMMAFVPVASEADQQRTSALIPDDLAKKKTEQPAELTASGPVAEPIAEAPPALEVPLADERRLDARRWIEVFPELKLAGVTRRFAEHLACVGHYDGRVCMQLDPAKGGLMQDSQRTEIAEALSAWLQRPVRLELELLVPSEDTPATCAQRAFAAQQEAALADLERDPCVDMLKQQFDAKIRPETLRAVPESNLTQEK